jgi:hypothetical protein
MSSALPNVDAAMVFIFQAMGYFGYFSIFSRSSASDLTAGKSGSGLSGSSLPMLCLFRVDCGPVIRSVCVYEMINRSCRQNPL